MDYAASNRFVVFTHHLDFGMLLAARKAMLLKKHQAAG